MAVVKQTLAQKEDEEAIYVVTLPLPTIEPTAVGSRGKHIQKYSDCDNSSESCESSDNHSNISDSMIPRKLMSLDEDHFLIFVMC